MSRKVLAEITQPVSEPDGTVVFQPGDRVDPDDPRVLALPPGHHRLVPVEVEDPPAKEPEPEPKQQPEPAAKASPRSTSK